MVWWTASSGTATPRNAIKARAVPPWAVTTVSRLSVACQDVLICEAFPFAESDLGHALIEHIAGRCQRKRRAQDVHGGAGAHERRRCILVVGGAAAVAGEQVVQDLAATLRLLLPGCIERGVLATLQAALPVPVGQPVADIIECGARHQSLATVRSGASGCFIP